MPDAIRFLASGDDDWLVGVGVITAAQEMDSKRRAEEIKATAALTGAKVAEVMSQMLR